MALGSTQPQSETSDRNLPGGKGHPVRKTDNVTVISDRLFRLVVLNLYETAAQ
jgi:hypothetical protein